MTTTRDRLRDAVQWAEARGFSTPRDTLTLDDARKLLAHHDALAALYAHAKLRPANDADTFREWAATWMDLNTAEQDVWAAITQDDAGGAS
jgi:hypothetical protein